MDGRHLPIADRLAPVLRRLWTDGYLIGALSSRSLLAHHGLIVKATQPDDVATVTMGVDWAHWAPGDEEAALELLGTEGMGDGLHALLEHAGVVLKGIEGHKLNQLAAILARGVQHGDSPATIAKAIRILVNDPKWAARVALTETTRAVSSATLWRYARNGVEAKEWMTAGDQHVCVPCNTNEDQGPVPLDVPFLTGDDAPPAHPLCRCSLAPAWTSREDAAAAGGDLTALGGGLGAGGEDLAAITTREADEILAQAEAEPEPVEPEPPPVVPLPTEVTGDSRHWAEGLPDTGLDNPIPVRDLQILQAGTPTYTISDGWAYKVDGVGYLVERGGTISGFKTEAEARRMVEDLRQFQTKLGAWGRFQKTYTVTVGDNPADAIWAQRYQQPGFRSQAMAGGGHTTLWHPIPQLSYDDTLLHEFGHNVDAAMIREGLNSSGAAWQAATRGPGVRGTVYDFKPTGRGLYLSKAPTLIDDPAALFPYGVTPYGQSAVAEDFAESVKMHLIDRIQTTDVIGRGRLSPDGPMQDLTFRDLFPARARVLDRVFASQGDAGAAGGLSAPVAAEDLTRLKVPELRALARDRGLTGYSRMTRPQLLDLLQGDVEHYARLQVAEAEEARKVADVAAEVHELAGNQASDRAMAHRIRGAGNRLGVDVSRLLPLVGDNEALLAEVDRMAAEANLVRIGEVTTEANGPVAFSREVHELVGPSIPAGTPVDVVRPGYSLRRPGGEEVQLRRAIVQESGEPLRAQTATARELTGRELRAANRERNQLIESRGRVGDTLAEMVELIGKKAGREVFEERLAFAQATGVMDAKDLAALERAAADPTKLRAAITRVGKKYDLAVTGRVGQAVKFDPAAMESVGGVDIPAGAKVSVVRPGVTLTLPDGTTMQLTKPLVRTVEAPVRQSGVARRPTLAQFERRAGKAATEDAAFEAVPYSAVRPGGADVMPDVDASRGLQAYRSNGYRQINAQLRGQDVFTGPMAEQYRAQTDEWIRGLDKIMAASAVDEDLLVWRGLMQAEETFGPREGWPSDFTGMIWRDNGFVSTSAYRSTAEKSYASDMLMRIIVPKGTHVAMLSDRTWESEILLDRGLTYRVIRQTIVERHGRPVRILDVEMLPS